MDELHTKYDVNIYHEHIVEWDSGKKKDLKDLNDICINNEKIKICFPLVINNLSSDIIEYNNSNGYFTEKEILEIIFSYYNGNIGDNILTELKKLKPWLEFETGKDLLLYKKYLYFNGFSYEDGVYLLSLAK